MFVYEEMKCIGGICSLLIVKANGSDCERVRCFALLVRSLNV